MNQKDMNLTNQELLNQLNQRIKTGKIKVNFNGGVLTDSGSQTLGLDYKFLLKLSMIVGCLVFLY
jgi:hypothetical protein